MKAICDMNLSRGAIQFYDKDKNVLSVDNHPWGNKISENATYTRAYTVPDGACYFRVNFRWFEYLEEDGETYTRIDMYNEFYDYIYDLQIEISDSSTYTDYVEHKSHTYSGTKVKVSTYDDITYIYNTDCVNMNATVRTEEIE